MEKNLYQVASEYVKIIERIETVNDARKLQSLEEKRVELHWRFIELLKQQGITSTHQNDFAFKQLFLPLAASGSIDYPQIACFAFLDIGKNARFRCDNSFC